MVGINYQVALHLQQLKEEVFVTEEQTKDIFRELLHFYFSLYFLMIVKKLPVREEMERDSSAFLGEARRTISDLQLPSDRKEWAANDDLFLADFDSNFRYYCRDEVAAQELEELKQVLRVCGADQSGGLIYLTAKLHFRVCKILRMMPRQDPKFFVVWPSQCGWVIAHVEHVISKIERVLQKTTK